MGFLNREKLSIINNWERSKKQLNRTIKKILNIIQRKESKLLNKIQMSTRIKAVRSKMQI